VEKTQEKEVAPVAKQERAKGEDQETPFSDSFCAYINSTKDLFAMLQDLSHCNIIALDCEGDLAGPTYGMSLLQISSPKRVYVVDMLEKGHEFMDAGLRDLLEDVKLLKVLHDCRHDSKALWHQYGCYLNPIFDTQGKRSPIPNIC